VKTKKALALLTLAAGLSACRKKQPAPDVMMIPSHAEAPESSAAVPAPTASPTGGVTVAGIAFTPPAGWKSETPSSSMRAAQYSIPGRSGGGPASFVVYYFGRGQGGTAAENVDRWEGQFLDASGQKARGKVSTAKVNGLTVTTVTAAGTYSSGMPMGPSTPEPDSALWGAIVEGPEGNVFLKVTGPRATVSAWEKDLAQLLSTIRLASTSM
jgi:hypothetical protein